MHQTPTTNVSPNSNSGEANQQSVRSIVTTASTNEAQQQIEFLENVNKSISEVQLLAKRTFSSLATQSVSEGIARAVVSAASTHATLGGNLATAAAAVANTGLAEKDYVGYFRTLVLTMLGELPRKGHLISDFDEMFDINYQKSLNQTELQKLAALIEHVKADWTSDAFLAEAPAVIQRMRFNLLEIADILGITEKLPSIFTEEDLTIAPHISLLNDFLNQLLKAMGIAVPTYQAGIDNNPGILNTAKKIISSHRDGNLPLAYKILRTAFLENTAQARIQGLKTIAENYGLDQHLYLTTHDIVEEYHGRDSLEELRTFVCSGHTSVETLETYKTQIIEEINAFYASMSQCA